MMMMMILMTDAVLVPLLVIQLVTHTVSCCRAMGSTIPARCDAKKNHFESARTEGFTKFS